VWYLTNARNAVMEHDRTISPRLLLTSHLSVDRANAPAKTSYPDPTKYCFPPILIQGNGLEHMPGIDMDTPWTLPFYAERLGYFIRPHALRPMRLTATPSGCN